MLSRCPTPRWSRPLARMRSPRLLTAALGSPLARSIEKRMKSTVARLGTVLAVLMLTVPLAASAQTAGKVYRIGILGDKASDAYEMLVWQTVRAGLRERGWNEGVNIRIEYRWAEGDAARLRDVAADLVRLKPDLLVTRASVLTG